MLELVAVVSIVSVLLWFIVGARKGVNIDNYTEAGLKEEIEEEKRREKEDADR